MEWLMGKQSSVASGGHDLSTAAGTPCNGTSPPIDPWIPAKVPGTVLQALVEAGQLPDPYVGLQSLYIKDVGEAGVGEYTYWFCTKFRVGEHEAYGEKERTLMWLQLEGANYSLEVYANGLQLEVGDYDRGTYLRRIIQLPLSIKMGTWCYLAILIRPPDDCGRIPAGGGQGGDHALGKDVAPQFLEGWDWTIAMADRSTGMWGSVSLRNTGPIRLSDAHAGCEFPVGASVSPDRATVSEAVVTFGVSVENGTPLPLVATLSLEVSHTGEAGDTVVDLVAEMPLGTLPRGRADVCFPPQAMQCAKLWWPLNMGAQHLYRAKFTVRVSNAPPTTGPSDSAEAAVGIRLLESSVDAVTGGRQFRCNGEKVFVRGGNYICGDAFLACPSQRYRDEVRMHALANINMIRLWGGAGLWPAALLGACDEAGIMVWLEFWITGDDDGRGSGDSQCPLDHALWLRCAEDAVRGARGHACLALFVGGNEQEPCSDLLIPLRAMLRDLAPATDFVKGSLWEGFADGHGGDGYLDLHDGPYDAQDPNSFYCENYYRYGFNPEVGSFGVPLASSVERFLPPPLCSPPEFVDYAGTGLLMELWGEGWDHHKHMSHGSLDRGVANQLAAYGVPTTFEEYCTQAQLASYVQYRALAEGFSAKMWRKHTGFLLWKTQSPWPALRGQIYDYYLEPTAALFAMRKACEPLHVQRCPITLQVVVINTLSCDVTCTVSVRMVGLESQDYGSSDFSVTVPSSSATPIGRPPAPACPLDTLYFLHLSLVPSTPAPSPPPNVYWIKHAAPPLVAEGGVGVVLPRQGAQEEYVALKEWRLKSSADVTASAKGRISPGKGRISGEGRCREVSLGSRGVGEGASDEWMVELRVVNRGSVVAMFVRVGMASPITGCAVLPCFASDSFFTLLPGEARDVAVSFRCATTDGSPPPYAVSLSGWNLDVRLVDVVWGAPLAQQPAAHEQPGVDRKEGTVGADGVWSAWFEALLQCGQCLMLWQSISRYRFSR